MLRIFFLYWTQPALNHDLKKHFTLKEMKIITIFFQQRIAFKFTGQKNHFILPDTNTSIPIRL